MPFPSPEARIALGVYDFAALDALPRTPQPFLVEPYILTGSCNVFVGDSGLGKTPFAVMLGLCVAAGIPFFGRPTASGRVLYCDSESSIFDFHVLITRLSAFLGLTAPPPNFFVWSPTWGTTPSPGDLGEQLFARVRDLQPALVIADPIRIFWPEADQKSDVMARLIGRIRVTLAPWSGTWLMIHHRRKSGRDDHPVSLSEDPHRWMATAAGNYSLINHTDARLGVDVGRGDADLELGGFLRGRGPYAPVPLLREFNTDGDAIGYTRASGRSLLAPKWYPPYDALPTLFTFAEAKAALGGTSGSATMRFLGACTNVGLLTRAPYQGGSGYLKVTP